MTRRAVLPQHDSDAKRAGRQPILTTGGDTYQEPDTRAEQFALVCFIGTALTCVGFLAGFLFRGLL